MQKKLENNISLQLEFDTEMQNLKKDQFNKLHFLEEAIRESLLRRVLLTSYAKTNFI